MTRNDAHHFFMALLHCPPHTFNLVVPVPVRLLYVRNLILVGVQGWRERQHPVHRHCIFQQAVSVPQMSGTL